METRHQQIIHDPNLQNPDSTNTIDQQTPTATQQTYQNDYPGIQINGANFLQQICFSWVYQLMKTAQQNQIAVKQAPTLPQNLRAEFQFQRYMSSKQKKAGGSLSSVILEAFGSEIVRLILIYVVVEVLYLSFPVLIYFNIDFIQNHRQNISYGVGLFFATIITSFMYNFIYTNLRYRFKSLGINVSTHLNLLIFHKSLKCSLMGQRKYKDGDIIGYSQIDTENMMYIGSKVAYFVSGVIEVLAGFALLYWFVGLAFLAGLIVLLVLSILTFFITRYGMDLTEKALNSRDARLAATSQFLNIIRFIKLNAMEKFFYKRIQTKREEELVNFRKKGLVEIVLVFLYFLTAPLLLTGTILTYFLINNTIQPSQVFTTMMIAVVFEETAQQLPKASSELLSILKSIERLNQYLLSPQIKGDHYCHYDDPQKSIFAIAITRGDFFLNSPQQIKEKEIVKTESQEIAKTTILKNINLNIQRGKLYMIFGDIGSGKSMLLLSILNELNMKNKSTVQVNGKIAFVSQKPWVFSGTVEENIHFVFKKSDEKLNEVIKYSCLEKDIKSMSNGFQTQIGENGINLSGGQKFRVDLARSLYSQSDIYLFDDILSAVDIHVGTFLMEQTIKGFLKGKTILMATHAIKFAEQADNIILMKDGEIVACDTYKNISQIPYFKELEMKIVEQDIQQIQQTKYQRPSLLENQNELISIEPTQSKSGESINVNALIEKIIVPEEQQKGQVDFQIFKSYIKLNGGYFYFLFLIILCFLIYSVMQTTASLFLSSWSQEKGENMKYFYIFAILTLSCNLFVFAEAAILLRSGVKQGREVHNNIIKGLLYAGLSNFFNRVPIGRLLNRLGKDLKELDEVIANTLSTSLITFFRIMSAIFVCIYTSTPYALIPITLVAVAFTMVRKFYLNGQTKLVRLQKITNSPVVSSFTNGIRGAISIRAYSSTQNYLKRHFAALNNYKQILFNHHAISAWFVLVIYSLGYIVNIFCIGYSMFSDSSNPASIGLLLTYILNINDQLFLFVIEESQFQTQLVSLERLYSFMNLAPQKKYQQYCVNWNEQEQQLDRVIKQGSIQFRHVSARYRQDLPNVVNSINCKINPGEKVGIVGRTGSGKTTLFNILIGIAQLCQGSILIDDKPIEDIPIKHLRRQITVIDQQPVVINSTFRQNLDLFGRYSDQELNKVMAECNIMQIVEKRGGLDGIVSNDALSAGEKQLICICRALLKNSQIVLIDEATANIDVRNDILIQQVIAEKFKGRTLLTIAHRLSTIANYDKVMIMEDGKLIEFGSPRGLYQSRGVYFQMVERYKCSGDNAILQ